MCGEIEFFSVFVDQEPLLAQDGAVEDEVDDLRCPLQIVRCVRKDDVELLGSIAHIEESVGLDRIEVIDGQGCGRLPDEAVMDGVDLHGRDAPDAPRGEFIADRPGAGEEVKHVAGSVIHEVRQDVEQVFLGEVGRRPRPEVAGRIDRPAAVFAAYDTHTTCRK